MMRFLFATLVALTLTAVASAQCGPRGCAPSSGVMYAPQIVQQAPAWEWKEVPDAPAQRALYRNGIQIGSWTTNGDYYRSYSQGAWGPKEDNPPHPLPVGIERRVQNFGVQTDKLPGRETYELTGKACSKSMAWSALLNREVGAPDLVDDSTLPRLVCVGTAEQCKAALSNPSLSVLLPKVQVVGRADRLGFDPTDYWPKSKGYGTGYYLVKPDGTKLWSATTWDGSAQPLLDALDGKTPAPVPTPGNSSMWTMLIVAAIILIAVWHANQRKVVA